MTFLMHCGSWMLSSSVPLAILGARQLPLGYFLNSIMQGPAKERLKIVYSNAECVSICGDKPTPQGYSFTCKHKQVNSTIGFQELMLLTRPWTKPRTENLSCISHLQWKP